VGRRFKAVKKYITDPADLAHFKMITSRAVRRLVELRAKTSWRSSCCSTAARSFNKDADDELRAVADRDRVGRHQLRRPRDGSLVGKQILFRVQDKKPYTNDARRRSSAKANLEVAWIDAADAAPERQLKTIDARRSRV
jgi:hypothetical protein